MWSALVEANMGRNRSDSTLAMHASPRCGAKTRSGKPCASPAVNGKRRCRMHGGAPGSGAPLGNRNAFKHGRYTKTAILQRREVRNLIRFLTKYPLNKDWGEDVQMPELPFSAHIALEEQRIRNASGLLNPNAR